MLQDFKNVFDDFRTLCIEGLGSTVQVIHYNSNVLSVYYEDYKVKTTDFNVVSV